MSALKLIVGREPVGLAMAGTPYQLLIPLICAKLLTAVLGTSAVDRDSVAVVIKKAGRDGKRTSGESDLDRVLADVIASAHSSEMRRDLRRGARVLASKGIESFEDLENALPHLRGVAGWAAVRLLEARGRRSARALVQLLERGDHPLAGESSKVLAALGGARARRGCVRVLESDAPKSARYAAAYALAFIRDDEAAGPLTALVLDQEEDPEVRGQAAEGLDYFGRQGGPHRRLAIRTALRGLADPSPVVRFWCVFALGSMRYTPAIPALKKLARRDQAVCPGWWRVCDEAADAVAVLQGRVPPERAPRPRA